MFVLFCLIAGITAATTQLDDIQEKTEQKTHTLIVFVHGTILPYPSPKTIFKTLRNRTFKDLSLNENFIYNLRYNSVYKYQPIRDYGLKQIEFAPVLNTAPYYYSFLAASLYKNALNHVDPKKYENLSFYTFGWDGKLSRRSRIKKAEILYKEIQKEIEKLEQDGEKVELIFTGHSHGGGLLLTLPEIQNKLKGNLVVEKLILLGTPVQSETEKLVTSTMFKKVYSFYSGTDLFQVADAISTQDRFSRRKFELKSMPNLTQIKVKIGKRNPAHAELWLFGAKSNWTYRKSLAIYPLPFFVFVPEILKVLDTDYSEINNLNINISKPEGKKYQIDFNGMDENKTEKLKTVELPLSLFEF
jgi:hypothetical protein